jgi:L-rhamnonate dehydratase
MQTSLSRRSFLAAMPAALPLDSALAETKPVKIAAIEIRQVSGHRDTVRWVDRQYQVDPLYIYDELRPTASIPVASGEHIQGRWEVYGYLKAGALNVVQCDPEWCGGTTELQKICSLASVFDVPVIPHGHSLHAALHVIASQSPAVCPLAEYLILKMQSYYHFEKHPPAPEKAHFALPDAPGYGIELDDARVESREMMHWS